VPARRKLTLVARDATVTLGAGTVRADDPVLAGGSLRLAGGGAAFDVVFPLPPAGWKHVGKAGIVRAWKYADRPRAAGPIRSLVVKEGKILKLAGAGADLPFTLGANPAPVDVTLILGGHRYCLRFGGTVDWKPGTSWVAMSAPAPAACAP
jgi:hypothetical protein